MCAFVLSVYYLYASAGSFVVTFLAYFLLWLHVLPPARSLLIGPSCADYMLEYFSLM